MRIVAGIVLVLLASVARALVPGEAAPAFALPTPAGKTLSLASLRGKVVYVDFWASWCTPCRRSFPWMSDMQARYRDAGLVVVGVNVDKRRADAERFLDDVPPAFTIVYDALGTTPSAYGVKAMPSSYLVGRDGKVLRVEEGFHEARRDALEARIRDALARR